MAMAMESDEKSRFTDIFDEPVDRLLSPIRGYEDKPILPLMETIKPVTKFFNDIEAYVFVALHNCQNSADELTQQESAAIHLYTMQFHGGPSFFVLLNESLRAENREQLTPWFSYLKLFLTALYKLPSQSGRIWRGISNVDFSSKYKKGARFAWWGVSSCTTDIEVLNSSIFLGKTGLRTLFSIECINGKSISNHSYFKNTEKEIVLMPGSYFEVIGQLNPAPTLHIIELKEIIPPVALVKTPMVFDKSSVVRDKPPLVLDKPSVIPDEVPMVLDKPIMVIHKPSLELDESFVVLDESHIVLDKPPVALNKSPAMFDKLSVMLNKLSGVIDKPSVVSDKPPLPKPANISSPSSVKKYSIFSQVLSKIMPNSTNSEVIAIQMGLHSSMRDLHFSFLF